MATSRDAQQLEEVWRGWHAIAIPIRKDFVRYVELVKPKLVLTLHGFASDFARDLRERGFEAWALSQENQKLKQDLASAQKGSDAESALKEARANVARLEQERTDLQKQRADLETKLASATGRPKLWVRTHAVRPSRGPRSSS